GTFVVRIDDHQTVLSIEAKGIGQSGKFHETDRALHADPGMPYVPCRDQVRSDSSYRVGGNREADADAPGVRPRRENRRIDADDLALAVEKGTARVSWIDRGGRLNDVFNDSVVLRLNRSACPA